MKKIIIIVAIIAVMLLGGCSPQGSEEPKEKTVPTTGTYAYVYAPDGTLLEEGYPSYTFTERGGMMTVYVNGVIYQTGVDNVILITPDPSD